MQYSVVNYKTVRENSDFRIDAEYYRQYFFDLLSKISQKKNFALSEISSNKTKRFKGDYDFEYLEISNISTADASCIYQFLSKEETPSRAQKILKNKDVVISTVRPNRNAVSFINEIEGLKVASSGFCVLRNFRNVLPEYIFILFKTYIFRDLLDRETKATMYPAVSEEDILNLRIPIFSLNFQKKIAGIVLELFKKQNQSKSLYSQAEQFLLSELGLLDWKPKHTLAFVKNFSDTQKAERIDAEYFQPKYEEIIEAVKKYKGGFDTISGQFRQNKKSFKKTPDKEYQYIEIGCVNISDGSVEPIKLQGSELPANAKIKFQKGDVIVSKVRPYRGAIGIVDSENYVGSGAFTVLQENGVVNKETLMVFLRLKPLLDFSLKFNTGTSYPTITDEDILNFPLPKIDSRTQEEIKKKITEMYETKKISKSLLEIAKRGVEIAIEKDEQEAEEWIESEIEKLGVKYAIFGCKL
jgi:type I restriction enzyme S subunit